MGRSGPQPVCLNVLMFPCVGVALYLASDESSFSTGSEFVADGGVTAS